MLTGRPPYATDSQTRIKEAIVGSVTPTPPSHERPELSKTIDEVVLKALETTKTDRYRDVTRLEEALTSIRSTERFSSTEFTKDASNGNWSTTTDTVTKRKCERCGSTEEALTAVEFEEEEFEVCDDCLKTTWEEYPS